MATVELQALHKRFGEVVALRSLDLAVGSGEFVSLLGPSGCGKTTALRIVAGFEKSDGGRVLVDGKDIASTPANRRNMGMVFQAYSLFPNMTARQNVEFGLRVRRRGRNERGRRADELLELVGLGHAMTRYPHQLSGGQQQRVALARALAIEPRVLLLDEPLSALDAKVRLQLREEIRRIQQELGITTLYVTHDQEEALSVSDRVVVLSEGQIEQVGTPAEIYGSPQTLFVAQFIGTMNLVQGTIATTPGIVDVEESSLPVDAARGRPVGQPVVVLLRPESIQLRAAATVGDGAPGISGVVASRVFLGATTRLNLFVAGGTLMVDLPSEEALTVEPGRSMLLTWDPHAPRVLDRPYSDHVETAQPNPQAAVR